MKSLKGRPRTRPPSDGGTADKHDSVVRPRLLYPQKEAAYILGINPRTLRRLIASQMLDTRLVGRRRMVPKTALEAFARRDHPVIPPSASVATTKQAATEVRCDQVIPARPSDTSTATG